MFMQGIRWGVGAGQQSLNRHIKEPFLWNAHWWWLAGEMTSLVGRFDTTFSKISVYPQSALDRSCKLTHD